MNDYMIMVCKEAVDKWGVDVQNQVLTEELAELIVEISHLVRGRGSLDKVAEEIADVEIMLQQIKYSYKLQNAVYDWHYKKLKRLEGKLK